MMIRSQSFVEQPLRPPSPPIIKSTSRNSLYSADWSPSGPNVQSYAMSHSKSAPRMTIEIPPISLSQDSPFSPRYNPYISVTNLPPLPKFDLKPSELPHVLPPLALSPIENFQKSTSFSSILDSISNPILDSKNVQLRLESSREFILGEGRAASVYLSSYKTNSMNRWELAAAKKNPDSSEALAEAYLLSKLSVPKEGESKFYVEGSKFIIKLLGVRDERDGIESVPGGNGGSKSQNSKFGGIGLGPSPLFSSLIKSKSLRSRSDRIMVVPLHRQNSQHLCSSRSFSNSLVPPIGSPSLDSPDTFAGDEKKVKVETGKKKSRYSAPPLPREDYNYDNTSVSNATNTSLGSPLPIDGGIVLILEYCRLGNLSQFIRNYPERIGIKRWITWARQITVAVAWIHENGLLHADLKTQNILITQNMDIRICDFGISLFLNSSTLDPSPIGLGTPSYSPPEFVQSPAVEFGLLSDVFMLGILLSTMISGVEPYVGMRSVERMMLVSKGGYYEWEERRRLGQMENSFSRSASLRSNRSRSSNYGSTYNGSDGLLSGLGMGRARADSGESQISARNSDGPWTPAALATRLLAPSEGEGWNEGVEEDLNSEDQIILSFLPPPSPTSAFERSTVEDQNDDIPLYNVTEPVNYPESGEPFQYFLNGEPVPFEIRALIRSMTSSRMYDRPCIETVLSILTEMEI